MTELQLAYDELKSSSEKEISDLRVLVASLSHSTSKGKSEKENNSNTFTFKYYPTKSLEFHISSLC